MADRDAIEEAVRDHYAAAARRMSSGCGTSTGEQCCTEPGIGAGRYEPSEVEGLPVAAVAASIGCANLDRDRPVITYCHDYL